MIKINKGFEIIETENYAKHANSVLLNENELIDCSLGVNPFGLSKNISKRLFEFDEETISLYPKSNENLKEIVARYWQDIGSLDSTQIHFTHGGMGGIELVNKFLLNESSTVLGYCPQFTDYIFDVEKCGAKFDYVPLIIENNYKFDDEEFLAAIKPEVDVIFIDNPNNPTGQVIDIAIIEKIVKKANQLNVAVIIDEVYGDYMSKENSAIALINQYDNLIIIRSFSKAYGMAGLRVGYVVLPKLLGRHFEKVLIAFPINSIGQHFVKHVLDDQNFIEGCVHSINEYKQRVMETTHKLLILESDPNLPIMTLLHPDEDIDLYDLFLQEGILTNSCSSYVNLGKNSVRLRIPQKIDPVLRAIEKIEKNMTKS